MCFPRQNRNEPIYCNPPNQGSSYSRAFKVTRIISLIGMLCGFLWYNSDRTYGILRQEMDSLSGHITTLETFLSKSNKKAEIEKYISEIADAMPQLKELASCVRNQVDKCDFAKGFKTCKNVVKEEIERFSADKTGRADFALESSGGMVVNTRNTKSFAVAGPSLSLFGIPLCQSSNSPRALIQPGVMPGECWAFQGSSGSAVIRLIKSIYVTGFTLEHISRQISPTGNTNTAPKEFSIWGLQCPYDVEGFFFGQYKYDINGPSVQFFPVKYRSSRMFDSVEFKVHSNHGHPEYTCVYRLRVHGELNK